MALANLLVHHAVRADFIGLFQIFNRAESDTIDATVVSDRLLL